MRFGQYLASATLFVTVVTVQAQNSLFAPAVNYAVGDTPASVFSADLDGDNDNDLAVANSVSDDVSILLDNGDGTFTTPFNYEVGNAPASVYSSDFDGDNVFDVAVANGSSEL